MITVWQSREKTGLNIIVVYMVCTRVSPVPQHPFFECQNSKQTCNPSFQECCSLSVQSTPFIADILQLGTASYCVLKSKSP